ncbi:MAG: response regulator [bacterium]|nr:response regulator [bacterium]
MMEKKKILIVDDSNYFQRLGESFLQRGVCLVLKAKNADDAFRLIRDEHPHVVVMDLNMPGMKGDDCCRELKSDPALKDIPVIMLANSWEKNAKERCLDAGCDDFISKPVNKARLYAGIKRYVNIVERSHVRTPCNGEVSFSAGGGSSPGSLSDISEGGMFIKSADPLKVGAELDAVFKLNRLGDLMKISGTVVRVVHNSGENASAGATGMGVRFNDVSDEVKKKVSSYRKLNKPSF